MRTLVLVLIAVVAMPRARAASCCSPSDCTADRNCYAVACTTVPPGGPTPLCDLGLGQDKTCVLAPINRCVSDVAVCCDANNGFCGFDNCSISCSGGWGNCDGKLDNGCETSTDGDVDNCGGCGTACSSNNIARACSSGMCDGACNGGWADCNGNKQADGCETFTGGDTNNCGGCGVVCSTSNVTPSCSGGTCSGACNPGWADCNGNKQSDGCETNTDISPASCGGCNMPCSANHVYGKGPTCTKGQCSSACQQGWGNCDGDLRSNGCEASLRDVNNCGACGRACSTAHVTPSCTAHDPFGLVYGCSGTCDAGWANCNGNLQSDGCESNTQSDVHNCGGCGVDCTTLTRNAAGVTCNAGTCAYTACLAGFVDCDGNHANGCESGGSCDMATAPPHDLATTHDLATAHDLEPATRDLEPATDDLEAGPRDLGAPAHDLATTTMADLAAPRDAAGAPHGDKAHGCSVAAGAPAPSSSPLAAPLALALVALGLRGLRRARR